MSRASKVVRTAIVLLVSTLPLALLAVLARSASAYPTLLYVKPGGLTSGFCSAWSHACDLQYALTNAISGTEIWVAQGIYTPGVSAASTFQLKSGVALYGGFAMTETTRDQRNWQSHLTVLSGDLGGDDKTDAHGVVTDTTQWDASNNPLNLHGTNAYHVVTGSGTDATAVLDGFTVTAGDANSNGAPETDEGGGLYLALSSPRVQNVTFSGNFASQLGGGMYNGNSGSGDGPRLTNVLFVGNSADSGGGLYNNTSVPVTFTNITFSRNYGGGQGGGMSNYQFDVTLINASFTGNWVDIGSSYGAALYSHDGKLTLVNTLFAGNYSSGRGGAIYLQGSGAFTNVTFSGNRADGSFGGGGVYADGPVTLVNCLFWGNVASAYSQIYSDALTVSYSDIQGDGFSGTGNLDADPQFIAPIAATAAPTTIGNYRLLYSSPVIDQGSNAAVTVGTDLDGNPRISRGVVDLGAYEYQPSLQISQQASANPVVPGGPLTYTLSITNTGAVDLHTIITDALPVQVTPSSPLTWPAVITAPAGVWTRSVMVTVTDGYSGTLTNVVTAVASEGIGDISTLTTQSNIGNQYITFNPLSDKILGDPPFSITATASSGLPVTFTTNSPACGVVGRTITLVSASQCVIAAHQAGNIDYFPAPDVTQSFTVYVHVYLPLIINPLSTPYLYVMQNGRPTYMANWANPAGCNWLGMAGQVFNLNGHAVQGLSVHLEGGGLTMDGLTGSKTMYGPGGYELYLSDHVFNSTNTYKIQLRDSAGSQLSNWYTIPTFEDCAKNLILVNFVQGH